MSTSGSVADKIIAIHDVQISKWVAAASHVIFVYDLILTSAEEYRYVWNTKWSLGKVLYILVRYPFNLVLLTLALYLNAVPQSGSAMVFCKFSAYWEIGGGWAQLAIVQVIMGLRTVALYNLKPRIVVLVGVLGCLTTGSLLSIDIFFALRTSFGKPRIDSKLVGCSKSCPDCLRLSSIALLPMMIFDTVVFFMTLYKHNQHSKRTVNLKSPLLYVLYRDGFIYFAIIFSTVLVNFIIYSTARPSSVGVMTPFLRCLMGITCGRLLLNLRGAILQPAEGQPTLVPSNTLFGHTEISANVGVWRAGSSGSSDCHSMPNGAYAAQENGLSVIGQYREDLGRMQRLGNNFEMLPLRHGNT